MKIIQNERVFSYFIYISLRNGKIFKITNSQKSQNCLFSNAFIQVVSALPPTHRQPLDDLSQKFQCASDTAIELINDAELENELQEFKRAVEISIKEFELCKKKANGTDILLLK